MIIICAIIYVHPLGVQWSGGPSTSNVFDEDIHNETISSDKSATPSVLSDDDLASSSSEDPNDFKSEKDILDKMTLEESVRYWALQTNQDHRSINLIMRIIRKKTDGILPGDARTLLHTCREKAIIENKAGGQYWYHGIRRCLTDFYRYVYLFVFIKHFIIIV